ncbi:MAG TPA: c-type cytochrome [Blastocatellia bacterium]|nr:c-type cytochrome [Blastocatellia bacterium]
MLSRSEPLKFAIRAIAILSLPFTLCLSDFDFSIGSRASEPQSAVSQIEAGNRVYLGSCSMTYCHAAGGVGGGGPRLRDREFTAEYLTRLITEGVPGTGMPAFKNTLSKQQIEQCIAYILSLSTQKGAAKAKSDQQAQALDPHLSGARAPMNERTEETEPPAAAEPVKSEVAINDSFDLRGDVESGRTLFFDSAVTQNCRVCHTTQNRGGRIGPDLTGLAGKPPREILRSIVAPHAAIEEKYATIAVTTRDGEKFTGVKRDEDEKMIRIYDTSTLPPVSRAFLKSEAPKIERLNTSAMPADYASKYSLKQLLDLISFLKSSNVSLKELF